jgi:hypothetical protein
MGKRKIVFEESIKSFKHRIRLYYIGVVWIMLFIAIVCTVLIFSIPSPASYVIFVISLSLIVIIIVFRKTFFNKPQRFRIYNEGLDLPNHLKRNHHLINNSEIKTIDAYFDNYSDGKTVIGIAGTTKYNEYFKIFTLAEFDSDKDIVNTHIRLKFKNKSKICVKQYGENNR